MWCVHRMVFLHTYSDLFFFTYQHTTNYIDCDAIHDSNKNYYMLQGPSGEADSPSDHKDSSIPFSQQPATSPYPEAVQSNAHPTPSFL
jgi:hypothetical protein